MNDAISQYDAYMQSETWRMLSDLVKAAHGSRCQTCGAPSPVLHVHHRTYKRLGHEHFDDLTVLCEGCHSDFHANHEYNTERHCFERK